MKHALAIAIALAVAVAAASVLTALSSQQAPNPSGLSAPPPAAPVRAQTQPESKQESKGSSTIKPLTPEQQEKLFSTRLDGGMRESFEKFANMFLVLSRLQANLGYGVGLMTSSKEIAESPLQSPFPRSYRPTFREFLDAIALQTSSQWKYDPTSKYFRSEVEHKAPVNDLAMFEFTRAKREKPFEVTLADGWKSIDKGNWVTLVPPSFPVGMDIYEMGAYSFDDRAKRKELLQNVRRDVALEWAQRVSESARLEDLKPAKVGSFDALYYEAMVDSQLNKKMRWRHWVFMVDDKCYFVVSTILPEFEGKIFPDVQKMLSTFKIKKN